MGNGPGLRRSRENRWIAGVCGGIAERFDWPPGLVRLIYVVVSVLSSAFPGTLVYLVLWACVPEDELEASDADGSDAVEASHLSRSLALGLAVFLGFLGVHRFYAGRIGTGVAMLLSAGGLGLWWLIDVVRIAAGEFRDSEGRRLIFWEAEEPDPDAFRDAYLERREAARSALAETE